MENLDIKEVVITDEVIEEDVVLNEVEVEKPKPKRKRKAKAKSENVVVDFEKAIENKSIFVGVVTLAQYDEKYETDVLLVDMKGTPVVMKKEELDYQINWKSTISFIGKEIYFLIKEIDENGTIFVSRKEAQEMFKDELVKRLKDAEVFTATVTGMVNYGAYIEINGIYGLLKNVDFSDGYIPVSEVLKVGDKVQVRLKKITAGGKLSFEPIEKMKTEGITNIDMFEKDQVVLGVVRSVRSWGAYVCIAPGVDALCSIPATGELEEGAKVSFKITKAEKDIGKVRGKILRILD